MTEYVTSTAKDLRTAAIAAARMEATVRNVNITQWGTGEPISLLFAGGAQMSRRVGQSSSKQFYDYYIGFAKGDALDRAVQDR